MTSIIIAFFFSSGHQEGYTAHQQRVAFRDDVDIEVASVEAPLESLEQSISASSSRRREVRSSATGYANVSSWMSERRS
jgi:hypothetical protein